MIVSLIFLLLMIIFMAFFIGKNLSNTCNFWFFKIFSDVQVSVLVLIAFACGILVSILAVLIFKIKKSNKKNKKLLQNVSQTEIVVESSLEAGKNE